MPNGVKTELRNDPTQTTSTLTPTMEQKRIENWMHFAQHCITPTTSERRQLITIIILEIP
jgi:hypothetical protein